MIIAISALIFIVVYAKTAINPHPENNIHYISSLHVIIQDAPPEIPARNYSRHWDTSQNGNQRVKSAVEAPANMAASNQSRRPLPHLPEEAYTQLMDEQVSQNNLDE